MPVTSRTQLIEGVATAMQEMLRARMTAGPEPWLHLDLTLPQLKALFVLGATGPARPSVIAEAIGVTATGLTGLLDRLEDRALVRREADPRDRRAIVVLLEPAGRTILETIYSAGREQLVEVLGRMAPDDLRALERGLAALTASHATLHAERSSRAASGMAVGASGA